MKRETCANFIIETSGMSSPQITRMLNSIQILSGYEYGYLTQKGIYLNIMKDTTTFSLIATLCRKNRVLSKHTLAVKTAVMAWLSGAGISCYSFEWLKK